MNTTDPIGTLSALITGPKQTWTSDAACADPQVDPDIFHAPVYDKLEIRRAQAVCGTCPVAQQCLKWALDEKEPHGIYGGLTSPQRRSLLRKRRAGRQRQQVSLDQQVA